MSLGLEIFSSLPSCMQKQFAEQIANYTQGKLGETPQMLPVEPSAIYQKQIGVVALENDTFMGYIGAMEPENHDSQAMCEVGTLWVPAVHRGSGIAHLLIASISAVLKSDDKHPYAFCNPLSEGIFKQSGYTEASPEEIPASAFSICGNCPMKPASGGCCDKIVISKGAPNESF